MADTIVDNKVFLEKEVLAPFTHLLQNQSKQIRNKIGATFNHWLKIPKDDMKNILGTTEVIYLTGLIMDDIEDNTTIRRGIPASHCVYGIPLTINCAAHVFLLALGKLFKIHPKAAEMYQRDFLEVTRGQSIEIYWRDNLICPTEEQYHNMLRQKNGGIYKMTFSIMQLLSEDKTDYSDLVLLIGNYYQLREDYLNLVWQEKLEEFPVEITQSTNTFCEDITEGKFTLPIIHAMGTPQGEIIRNILRQRPTDIHMKKYFVSLLEKSGSLEYTRNVLKKLDLEIRELITSFGGNPELEAIFDDFLVDVEKVSHVY